ncbi:MAG: peptidase family C69 [Actinobacteria bacterium]|nr:peptidase family C69 [Actinomycetota bacterium]
MCDTLCVIGSGRTLFAKNSDRPLAEPQVVRSFARRPAGAGLHTQYLEIPDADAYALTGSRPSWLWGLEHGVNEHGVAIGNEKVWTIDDPVAQPPALIGMDLVRLGLERATTAEAALDVITTLLEAHGQGGSGARDHSEPYFSSFLIADPRSAWILETSARTWAAQAVEDGAAISNRVSLGTAWTRASADVAPGRDFQDWRDPDAFVAIADQRLAVTRATVATGASALGPRDLAAAMRHHGERPWGAPGTDATDVSTIHAVPLEWEGVTVCMHVGDYQTTTASMIAELTDDPDAPMRAWAALGSPCASVYVPVFPPLGVPPELGDDATWERFRALRERAEASPDALGEIRSVLAAVEAELWSNADDSAAGGPEEIRRFLQGAWAPVEHGLDTLGV